MATARPRPEATSVSVLSGFRKLYLIPPPVISATFAILGLTYVLLSGVWILRRYLHSRISSLNSRSDVFLSLEDEIRGKCGVT